jgi:hypothetical protein
MQENAASVPNKLKSGMLDDASLTTLATTGEVEIAGRRYVTRGRLAPTLNRSPRTIARWDAARIGPPKIQIGKLILYDLGKVPDWLAAHETEPVRVSGRRR